MSFSLDARTVRDVVVLDLFGRVTVGDSVLLLRDTVRQLAKEGSREFILNLDGVSYIDSCGLGELVVTYTSICNRGGSVSLLNPSERAMELLELTRLSAVFDVFDDETNAVQAMSGSEEE